MAKDDEQPFFRIRCLITAAATPVDQMRDLAILDSEEADKAARFVKAADRRDYILAHALLRRTLTAAVPEVEPEAWRFERAARGKPYLPADQAGALRFNLSHTNGLVACAVGRGADVGIDVEARSWVDDVEAMVARVFSADERAQFDAIEPSARTAFFLDIWTLKEACLKATGSGISAALHDISFDLREPATISTSLSDKSTDWHFSLFRPNAKSSMGFAAAKTDRPPVLDVSVMAANGDTVPNQKIRDLRTERVGAAYAGTNVIR